MSDFMHFVLASPPPPPRPGGEAWNAGAARWARVAGPLVRDAIKTKAPIGQGDSAGRLKNSITYRSTAGAGSMRLEFVSPLSYVKFVVDGTRPHTIVPRNVRVLHFRTDAGVSVFASRVNHPGTRANAFARRAIEPRIPEIQNSFSTVMREVFGGPQ